MQDSLTTFDTFEGFTWIFEVLNFVMLWEYVIFIGVDTLACWGITSSSMSALEDSFDIFDLFFGDEDSQAFVKVHSSGFLEINGIILTCAWANCWLDILCFRAFERSWVDEGFWDMIFEGFSQKCCHLLFAWCQCGSSRWSLWGSSLNFDASLQPSMKFELIDMWLRRVLEDSWFMPIVESDCRHHLTSFFLFQFFVIWFFIFKVPTWSILVDHLILIL